MEQIALVTLILIACLFYNNSRINRKPTPTINKTVGESKVKNGYVSMRRHWMYATDRDLKDLMMSRRYRDLLQKFEEETENHMYKNLFI